VFPGRPDDLFRRDRPGLLDVMSQVGFTDANALGTGGQQLGTHAQSLQTQLNNLIADMEHDRNVMQGNSLGAFQQAKAELHDRFAELVRWCGQHGIKLTDAQIHVGQADDAGQQVFTGATSG
jgi:hypothetical protein